jgi:hypothetical protein
VDELALRVAALPTYLGFAGIAHGAKHSDIWVILAEGRVYGHFEPAARISLIGRNGRRSREMK